MPAPDRPAGAARWSSTSRFLAAGAEARKEPSGTEGLSKSRRSSPAIPGGDSSDDYNFDFHYGSCRGKKLDLAIVHCAPLMISRGAKLGAPLP